MTILIRKSAERGYADRGWLQSWHSFSFGDYQDPRHMGFRVLRVLNEDVIAPGRGFGPHGHRDMEILTYMLAGKLRHRDSMGEERTLGENEVQAMSAGTGVVHSEFNASAAEPSHSVQIWIEPASEDVAPAYRQIAFGSGEKRGRLRLLAAPHANDPAAATIHQDARLYVTEVAPGDVVTATLLPGRHAWVQVLRGEVLLGEGRLGRGDGAAISGEPQIPIRGEGEVLLFDLP
jgi:hypothetical protein